jgi:C-terminal processing protease CtpA/Prc
MRARRSAVRLLGALTLTFASLAEPRAEGPGLSRHDRDLARQMLESVKTVVQHTYYDPTFHGIDMGARFKAADAMLERAPSLAHAYTIIAQVLLGLGDSHTFFVPPARPNTYDNGWNMQMVGDDCLVAAVDPSSDAAAKGLRPGDRVLRMENFIPSRSELWKLQYAYSSLAPRPVLTIVVQNPGAAPRRLELSAKVTRGPSTVAIDVADTANINRETSRRARILSEQTARLGSVTVWKLASFELPPEQIDRAADDVLRQADSLILDLRGNRGGRITALERLTGRLVNRDITIANRFGRRPMKPLIARARKGAFAGRIVVLIDAASASASELLARTLQIEKRAVVIGDRSAGSVREARMVPLLLQKGPALITYFASVTDADLVMSDGHSLEGAGVEPDIVLLPTTDDLSHARDPVLARAAAILGVPLDPSDARALFPVRSK